VIDRVGRDRLAEALSQLILGQITNDEFNEAMPDESDDPALKEVWDFGWSLYSDTHAYRLTGWNSPSAEALGWANRAIIFLRADLPYEWPPWFRGPTPYGMEMLGCFALLGLPLGALAVVSLAEGDLKLAAELAVIPLATGAVAAQWLLTRNARAEEERRFWASGDRDVWPFLRRADYDAARRKQPL
jgi:hypothetical protein